MNNEQIKKIVEDTYDESREDTVWSMVGDFYSRKMLSTVILVWVWAIIFLAGATYCAVQFFRTDQTRSQIMYAAIFICCVHGIGLIKIFAWEMMHRHGIKREIKRLEIRTAELASSLAEKS
jgi:uncharacterized membrane protein YbjE (DUF340 family)